jgi:hypothetical protein
VAGVGCGAARKEAEGNVMNTVVAVALAVLAQVWVIWIVYQIGFSNGWLDGMDRRSRD